MTDNLFFIHSIDTFGDAIVELHLSTLSEDEFKEQDADYFSHLCSLDTEDAKDMEAAGFDPTKESDCIRYAKDVLSIPIPDEYNLIVLP